MNSFEEHRQAAFPGAFAREDDSPAPGAPADGGAPAGERPAADAGSCAAPCPDAPLPQSGADADGSIADADERQPGRLLGVRLRRAGQVFFLPGDHLETRVGGKVIVECEQGLLIGEVERIVRALPCADPAPDRQASPRAADGSAPGTRRQPVGRIVGPASARDIAQHAENRILAGEAAAFCNTSIRQYSLDMKLVDVEVLHDRSKILFYFTAPSRIDFRDLVKDLVRNYRTRIELRQIGVRHETQMVGGIGSCGMICCCHRYLRKFAPVTIKMAKEQNLFLNPAKLSGMCGRLLCCLSFEQSNYEEFNRRCPKLGKRYTTSAGALRIVRANMFTRMLVAVSDAREERECSLEEWESLAPRRLDATPQGAAAPARQDGGQAGDADARKAADGRQERGPNPDESM